MEGEVNENPNLVNITVKFKGRSIPISISSDSSIEDLKSILEPHTNVIPRCQKLISKGRVSVDTMTLAQLDVTTGTKFMLIASEGLHIEEGPDLRNEIRVDKQCLEYWWKMGAIELADCNLKTIPEEVWDCATSITVFDISGNNIQYVSKKIGRFNFVEELYLDRNNLSTRSIEWDGLSPMTSLEVLSLSHNHLTTLPGELRLIHRLRHLDVSYNELNDIPSVIACIDGLKLLKANNNRISTVSPGIELCSLLVEVDLSANDLIELPETIECLRHLKVLHLSNNGLKSLPGSIFKKCVQLSTLSVHNTEITMDSLRQYEGWEDFDERQRAKLQEEVDDRVVESAEFEEVDEAAEFEEGADKS